MGKNVSNLEKRFDVLKEKILDYLRKNEEVFMKTNQKTSIRILQDRYLCTFYFARKVYKEWLEKDVGIRTEKRKKAFKITQRRFRDISPDTFGGQNGIYSTSFNNNVLPGLVLINNKGYLRFDNREEVIEFFDEILVAFDKIEGVEDEV